VVTARARVNVSGLNIAVRRVTSGGRRGEITHSPIRRAGLYCSAECCPECHTGEFGVSAADLPAGGQETACKQRANTTARHTETS
jgi:hypothetical protein